MPCALAQAIVDRQVEAELGVGEGGDVDGNVALDRALQDRPVRTVLRELPAEQLG